jgi:hypothetical protein
MARNLILLVCAVLFVVKASLSGINESTTQEIQRFTRGSTRRLMKLIPRLKRLQALNPSPPAEKLAPAAAGQIIA